MNSVALGTVALPILPLHEQQRTADCSGIIVEKWQNDDKPNQNCNTMTSFSELGRPFSFFHLGALRFGVHGVGGVVCCVLTEFCRRRTKEQPFDDDDGEEEETTILLLFILLLSSQVGNFALATHAGATLLGQVPHQTAIVTWPCRIVAPHREAFVRTTGMTQYLVVRVVCKLVFGRTMMQQNAVASETMKRYITLACLALPYFGTLVPRSLAWTNGNTWIFVIPIWLGTTGDWISMAIWGDVIALHQLLQVQLVGLFLAFGFTLAFRQYVPMPVVYAVAAWRVAAILREGWVTIQAG